MTDQAMSPLRRRMIEDVTIRKFAPKTQHDYLQRVKNFAAYLGRSPDTASSEDDFEAQDLAKHQTEKLAFRAPR
jgi:integrase/recombinase XerD